MENLSVEWFCLWITCKPHPLDWVFLPLEGINKYRGAFCFVCVCVSAIEVGCWALCCNFLLNSFPIEINIWEPEMSPIFGLSSFLESLGGAHCYNCPHSDAPMIMIATHSLKYTSLASWLPHLPHITTSYGSLNSFIASPWQWQRQTFFWLLLIKQCWVGNSQSA